MNSVGVRCRTAGILFMLALLLAPFAATGSGSAQASPSLTQPCSQDLANPVLNASDGYVYTTATGNWFAYNNTYQEPTVIKTSSGLRMWYAGFQGRVWGIYTATSVDGSHWAVDPAPVLTSGPNGSWDYGPLFAPSVFYNGSGYMMYFRGDSGSIYTRSIGVAFSADGTHWTEYADNPVLRPGPGTYDSNWIYDANVMLRNGTYYMWYAGQEPIPASQSQVWYFSAIDLATSGDGIHWTKYQENPVFLGVPGETFSNTVNVGHPDVLAVNGTLVMFYGDGYSIRYAYSYDGINWTPAAGVLVNSSESYWMSQELTGPAALLNGSRLSLWYYGNSPSTSQTSPNIEGIGLSRCALTVPLVVTITTTATTTITETEVSTSTQTVTSVSTATLAETATVVSTVTSVSTVTALATAVPLLEASTAVAAALAAVLLYLVLRRRVA